jgi:hypothetical protein
MARASCPVPPATFRNLDGTAALKIYSYHIGESVN